MAWPLPWLLVSCLAAVLHIPCAGARPLSLHYITDGSAVCNDGSRPAYYLQEGEDDVLLVWLEGGGDCGTQETCDERFSAGYKMSTKNLSKTLTLGGIFSGSTSDNPIFAGATKVFVPYCSSDSWIGNRAAKVLGYHFQGQRIISAVLRDLRGLASAKLLAFGGCSAGGRGAMYNLDRVCASLPNKDTVCRGILDAAWWVTDGGVLEQGAADGFGVWNGSNLMGPCIDNKRRSNQTEEHLCLFGPHLAPHIHTPFVVHEEQFDYFLLGKAGVEGPSLFWGPSSWAKAFAIRDKIRSTLVRLPSPHAAFSAAVRGHCLAETDDYWRVRLSSGDDAGLSFEHAVRMWLSQNGSLDRRVHLEECAEPNCSMGSRFEPSPRFVLLLLAAMLTLCAAWPCAIAVTRSFCKDTMYSNPVAGSAGKDSIPLD